MTENTDLLQRREELKRRLMDGEYKTLIDVSLDGVSRIIQKVIRTAQPISPWVSSGLLYLIMLLIPNVLVRLGDPSVFTRQTAIVFPGFFFLRILLGYATIAIMVAGNIYLHHVFTTFQDSVLDKVESIATLDDFEHWLTSVCDRKTHFLWSIVGGVVLAAYIIFSLEAANIIVTLSTTIGTVLVSIFSVAFIYLLVYMVALSARIGRYHLKLYIANPNSSEVIGNIAGLLSNFVYMVAIYAAFITWVMTLLGPIMKAGLEAASLSWLAIIDLFIISLFWTSILAMFILNQRSISSIIKRAKWKTLNEIQANVEQLHTSNKLGEKDTMEAINRLMDYYDRILKTHSSAFNTEALWSLINSLLLPLLALLLGNLDKIIALFH
jgi:hypothetical protein